MTSFGGLSHNNKLRRYALLPAKLLVWTAKGQLREKLKTSRDYRLVVNSGVFDVAFYRQQISSSSPDLDPIRDYLTVGAYAGRNPNPLFDSRWYLEQNPDVAASGMNPLVHFLSDGYKEGRNPHPLFDVRHYRQNHPEVVQSGANPLADYLQNGAGEPMRYPHVLFDNAWYLAQNPDVAHAGQNPLVHFLNEGWKEGRSPHPLFDTAYYLSNSPDLVRSGDNPLIHFLSGGFKEGRNPNALFDCAFYVSTYSDVAGSGANPLVHYISSGEAENRIPHPLFDPGFYGHRETVSPGGRPNSLAHYLHRGVKEHLAIHPLFNVDWYLEQHPELADGKTDPVRHYLEEGWQLRSDPCELFDTSYYLDHYPDVAQTGQNPLVHYLREGAYKGYNPNPLFESAYYLKQYPDIAAIGQNPLVHYVVSGAFQGRAPSPFFDSLFYLRRNPSLRRARINPLAHYLTGGGSEEGKDPSPFFSTPAYLKDHPEVSQLGINPLVHFLGISHDKSATGDQAVLTVPPLAPRVRFRVSRLVTDSVSEQQVLRSNIDSTIICVSHVAPDRPRAGNEYRVQRLWRWLRTAGYRVLPVLSPLADDGISDDQVVAVAKEFGNSLLCRRDGRLLCCLRDEDLSWLSNLDGCVSPGYEQLLGEDKPLAPKALQLLDIDRTFCHDALVRVVTELALRTRHCAVLAEYIFMSRLLPLLPEETLRIIDTHDVFSAKHDKVVAYGIRDDLSLTESEEAERLSRGNLILAIQPEEQKTLQRLSGAAKVITVGVDFPVQKADAEPTGRRILFVASDNAMNVRGLRDFLRFAWPAIRNSVPDAELLVAGTVSSSVRFRSAGIELLGPVSNLDALYKSANVTINPAVAGTGLKVKTLEALSFFRPVVTWPTGIDGLDPELASMCCLAADWFEFQQHVTRILLDARPNWYTQSQKLTIQRLLSPATVYESLKHELSAFFADSKVATA